MGKEASRTTEKRDQLRYKNARRISLRVFALSANKLLQKL